ncbi:methanethiol S-methyltransferase [Haloarchaeobius sp. HRN-SO-5]|uniref:methanethiol S-methyltransferase n=1 Tax=Haloarchaeobius sp. HRN-SO-5 TaxID=3446118 RepID=UPI003EBABE74
MTDRPLRRYAVLGYGWAAYLLALAAILYAVGFLANVAVPKSVDAGAGLSAGDPVVVDLALVGAFGLQHSLMARPWFKDPWTRLVPEPVERSTYVLLASVTLLGVMWGWNPLPETVWQVDGPGAAVLWAVYASGWVLMFAAVNAIDRDDLMGLRQVTAYFEGRTPDPLGFQTPTLYRFVRHPIVTGFLLAFWVTPDMTVGHLVFAAGTTGYVLVGVKLEERDLVRAFGDRYRRYRDDVPMLVPRPWRSVPPALSDEGDDVR